MKWSNETKQIIIVTGEPMTEKEMADALRGSEQAPIWRALIQLIEQFRAEYFASAYASAVKNNPLALASDVGSHEALTGLLNELVERRQSRQ